MASGLLRCEACSPKLLLGENISRRYSMRGLIMYEYVSNVLDAMGLELTVSG